MDKALTIAPTLARFVTGLDHAAIPAVVRERARLHLLDSVGIALAAAGLESARKACAVPPHTSRSMGVQLTVTARLSP